VFDAFDALHGEFQYRCERSSFGSSQVWQLEVSYFTSPILIGGTLIHFHLTAGDKVKVEGFSFRGSLVDRPLPVVGVSGVGENRFILNEFSQVSEIGAILL
jgi:hypothetical protein